MTCSSSVEAMNVDEDDEADGDDDNELNDANYEEEEGKAAAKV
jgi:hypothetical protein